MRPPVMSVSVMTLSIVAGAVDAFAGEGAGMVGVSHNGSAVHEDIADAGGQVMRIRIGGVVDHRLRVEDHDVGIHPVSQEATIAKSETIGHRRAGLANGVLECHPALLTDITTEDPGVGAIGTGMDKTAIGVPLGVNTA